MSIDEVCRLVAELEHADGRYTLEDAEERDGDWVAYLWEARSWLTYRVADYTAYQAHQAYLPGAWITHEPRVARTGCDDSADEAEITPLELRQILEQDRAGAPCRLRALHVRYDFFAGNRYRVQVLATRGPLSVTTLAAYDEAQRAGGPAGAS